MQSAKMHVVLLNCKSANLKLKERREQVLKDGTVFPRGSVQELTLMCADLSGGCRIL